MLLRLRHLLPKNCGQHWATPPQYLTPIFLFFNEEYLKESAFVYPISINGKKRAEATFAADALPTDIEAEVRNMEVVQKWTTGEGKDIKKVIIVPGRMVNIVA